MMSRLQTIFDTVWEQKFTFLGVYFLVFLLSYLVLVAIDFVPEAPQSSDAAETAATTSTSAFIELVDTATTTQSLSQTEPAPMALSDDPVLPVEIFIERLDKTITVLNPTSRNISELDEALLSGVVRHPDSAHLEQTGTVFILGHSSYLPNVLNRNFQAFNGIQELQWGDVIEVRADAAVYVYRVNRVYEANAQELVVPIAGDEKLLTLATCDSFGSIEDRFIVEAKQVEVRGT
jgi:LPXTG-site transpeptidase (sortase) family protein